MKLLIAVLPVAGLLFAMALPGESAPRKAAPVMPPGGQAYKKVGDRELQLWVVKPHGWKATDRRPAIVLFHGGGWMTGTPMQFSAQGRHFASLGMVCVQPQYRLLSDDMSETPLVCIQDAKSAMRWVRAHAAELGIDPDRIAAGGGSAGGHLAACTALLDGLNDPQDDLKVSAKPQALVLFNPVFDNSPGNYGYDRVGKRYMEFSPADHIVPGAPPTIVFLGTRDHLIPVATVEKFQNSMKKVGARCDVKLFEGKDHGFFNSEPAKAETLKTADDFLVSLGWIH